MKHYLSKLLVWALVIAMAIGSFTIGAFAEEEPSAIQTALDSAVEGYYQQHESYQIDDWWELLAIYMAGEELTDYTLPQPAKITEASMPSDYVSYFVTSLIKGETISSSVAMRLAESQNEDGSFGYEMSNQQAWAMIALDLYNRNADESDLVEYNEDTAIEYLMNFQVNGDFYYSSQYPYPGVDYTGAAALALAPHINDMIWPEGVAVEDIIDGLSYDLTMYGSYGNAGAAAFALFGYQALGINQEDPVYGERFSAALTELMSYQLDNGGFYSPWGDPDTSDAYYTKQAALALAESVGEASSILTLSKNETVLFSVDIKVQYENIIVEARPTVTEQTTVALAAAIAAPPEADLGNHIYYVNGIISETPTVQTLSPEDLIVVVPEGITHLASLTSDYNTINLGEDITLTLSLTPIVSESPAGSLSGAAISYGGITIAEFTEEEEESSVLLTPVNAGAYSYSVVWPAESTYSPATHTINVLAASLAVPVSVRIEGIEGNLLYYPSFVVTGSTSLLTVFDAIEQSLDHSGLPHNTGGGYISSINGVENDNTYTTARYWMYTINEERYHNGSEWVTPNTQIEEDDEIVVYCGSWATYPFIDSTLEENGDVKIQVTSYQYDQSYNAVLSPVSGASVFWADGTDNYVQTITDDEGYFLIPAEKAGAGSYTLQVEQLDGEGIPLIVRLAPGYEILVTGGDAEGSVPSQPSETIPKVTISVMGPNGSTLKNRSSYTFTDGMTALDILRRTGLSIGYNDTTRTYVASINGIEEFDYGPTSGWLYSVNGDESILIPASSYRLDAGDEVVWFYTDDYTEESGSSSWTNILPLNAETLSAFVGEDGTQIPYTISRNTVTLNLEGDVLSQLVDRVKKANILTFEINDIEDAKKIVLPTAALRAIAAITENNTAFVGVTMKFPQGEITFDKAAFLSLSEQVAGETITFSFNRTEKNELSGEDAALVGDRPVFEVSVESGNKFLATFEGELLLGFPYEQKSEELAKGICISHLNGGTLITEDISFYDVLNVKAFVKANHLSSFVVTYDESKAEWPFTDVKREESVHWFYLPVKYMYETGLFNGVTKTSFAPNGRLSRAMLVSVLARRAEADLAPYNVSPFADVEIDSWYGSAVAWAEAVGLASGYFDSYGNKIFAPEAEITRQDLATLLKRYGEIFEVSFLEAKTESIQFGDQEEISEYAKNAVATLQQTGAIKGSYDKTGLLQFLPKATATRAETASMLYHLLKK